MKIKVCNLGIIKEAEIQLKPLTVFIGPNNSGKTWSAYALSGILGWYGWERYMKVCDFNKLADSYPLLDKVVQMALDEGNATIDVVQFADEHGEQYINNVAKNAKSWLPNFMGTKQDSFKDLEVEIKLADTKSRLLERVQGFSLNRQISFDRRKKKGLLNAFKASKESILYLYTEGGVLEKLPDKVVKDFLVGSVFEIIHRAFYSQIYTFPTERTFLVTLPVGKEKRSRKNSSTRMAEQEKEVDLPYPIGSFLHMLDHYRQSTLDEREEEAKENPQIKEFIDLAAILETKILKGSVDFSSSQVELQREIFYKPLGETSINLEMPVVSSMVKELSSLVLCLRYMVEPGEWLIIDEPEMNLHPKAQARLMEFLVMLVNAGLYVLITTHSPYMVDHLTNLMKASTHQNLEEIQKKFYLQDFRAFISKEDVSVQVFGNGTVENALEEDGIINWRTFGQVSDRVTQIYTEL